MFKWLRSEDSWAVLTGFVIVTLGLLTLVGVNALGWVAKASEWLDPSAAVGPSLKSWNALPRSASVALTYLFLIVILGVGARYQGQRLSRFVPGFTLLFILAFGCWLLGHNAYIAATPEKRSALKISWSLGLTGEAGYLIALALGLLIGNIAPAAAYRFREAARTEWYIKTAIVIIGATLGVKAAEESTRAAAMLFRGLAAIVEAYLIYWALVYFVARKWFGFSREWAAPLASGISICGVSAAITTGAAIRPRPIVPVMVSSLVVVFSVIEMVVLPIAAKTFLADEPMVAAAWMGLAVKTDGAAISTGAITESLVYAEAAGQGIHYQKGWMVLTTTTVKVFIDLFIGVWAIVLAFVWAYGIEKKPEQGVPFAEIWCAVPQVCFWLCRDVCLPLLPGTCAPRQGRSIGIEERDGPMRSASQDILRAHVLRHRPGGKLPQALGRRAGPPCIGLCGLLVRLHHLDRAGDFMAILPRRPAAAGQPQRFVTVHRSFHSSKLPFGLFDNSGRSCE